MAKVLKATIVTLSEAPGGEVGVAGRAMAKYVLGDDADESVNQVKFLEIPEPDFTDTADAFYGAAVTAIRAAEGIA